MVPPEDGEISKMIPKHPVFPGRVRRVPAGFGWVDHRLVRERWIEGRSHASLSLYLLLVTVADAEGLSYWSEGSTCRLLGMDGSELRHAAAELETARLAAYAPPIWQVLELERGDS
jgi:hypothetical protein